MSRKTSDLYTAHPDYAGRPTRGGRMDHEVVADFLRDPQGMARVAEAIRTAAAEGEFDELPSGMPGGDDDPGADEGGLLMRRHLVRERDAGLKRKKIESVWARGENLACRVCGFDYERTYGVRGAGYIECHHAVPLHVTGRRTTRLDDLILICANCHRMIHRGPGWLSPSELRDCLAHAMPFR